MEKTRSSAIIHEHIEPPFWAMGGHLQTILGHLLRITPRLPSGESVVVTLPDGDALSSIVYQGTSDTVIYLFHGLGGNTSATYMIRQARTFVGQGHTVILTNHRGCGDGRALPHQKPYHSGSASDLAEVIRYGRARFPAKKQIAVGFSLSGNALLLLLSTEQRPDSLPDAAVAVNAPIRLESAADRLRQGLNRIYDFRFVRQCAEEIEHRRKMGWLRDVPRIRLLATLFDLDDLYTAREAGFANRERFYALCSAAPGLSSIRIPTVMITAQDDPFVDVRHYLEAERSPAVRLQIVNTGGHMGYLERGARPWKIRHWMDGAVPFWVEILRQESYS